MLCIPGNNPHFLKYYSFKTAFPKKVLYWISWATGQGRLSGLQMFVLKENWPLPFQNNVFLYFPNTIKHNLYFVILITLSIFKHLRNTLYLNTFNMCQALRQALHYTWEESTLLNLSLAQPLAQLTPWPLANFLTTRMHFHARFRTSYWRL